MTSWSGFTAKNMYRNHRVHLLTPNREPSRHQNVPTVSHGPSRNIISQSQYLKATSQWYADFSRFSSIFYFHQALGERTDGGMWTIITTCVLQLAVDEASSNQPFHPLLVLLSLECAFCLFGGVYYYYYVLRNNKKLCENHTLRETQSWCHIFLSFRLCCRHIT